VSSSSSAPGNPRLIIVDSSVLVQLVATEQLGIFRRFRSDYGVQAAIVQAVEAEVFHLLNTVAKFRGRQEQLRKALGNNTLALVDREFLAPLLGTGVDAWIRQMESEGERLYVMVDRGEAFSHAASIVLDVPIATTDTSAVYRLLKYGEKIPRPIIRFWDLVVFAHQIGDLDEAGCDRIRKTLSKLGERTHPCFTERSFRDGVSEFYARLICSDHQPIGAAQPQERLDERLVLNRMQGAPPALQQLTPRL
jgi:hypothetical protein